ncbi:MAG: molybdopterin-dependent oxidoreductase [Magnetococcales bacterium]|nr:molybdopterin-dependent oxidoreductase [Nitrospirota bacterium]
MMQRDKISRRSFLKQVGGTTVAVSSLFGFDWWRKNNSRPTEIKKIPTQCHGCGANRCGIYVYVKDNRVWKIEGNPGTHNNGGSVCPRGHGYIHELYSPARLRQPLKRTDNGTYEPITWEQAFKEISVQLNLIIMEHGPQSVFWLQYPMANAALSFRFMHALGSPNTCSHGSTCYTARNAGFNATYGGLPDSDIQHCQYLIIVGRNPTGGIKLYQMKELTLAKDRGAKIVVVDPRHSETAVIANEWLSVKPGTDLAFLLALLNVIIEEGLYDQDFVNNYTVGFDKLADETISYPPEWAERVCDIPKGTIYRIARELASYRPKAMIHRGYHGGYGAGYLNSFQTARAVAIVNALLGNYERTGGLYMPLQPTLGELKEAGHPSPDIPGVPKADGSGIPGRYPAGSYSDGISHAIPELALSGVLKAGFVYHSNPARTNPNPKRVIAGYRNLQLLVTIDCVMSETAALAHYVLPESFFLERDDSVDTVHSARVAQLTITQQVVPPIHDTKPLLDILKGISNGVGIEKYFNFTNEELNHFRLKPFGVTLETLKKEGVVEVGPHWVEGFKPCKTPSGKVEIYSDRLSAWSVDPLPRWQEPLLSPDKNDPHSFRLIHGKQSVATHSMTANIAILMQLSIRYNLLRLWMNTQRGQRLGLKDGDMVVIDNELGRGVVKVRLTEGIHPSAVWLPSGYGIFSQALQNAYGIGPSYNDFLNTHFDPVVGHVMSSEVIVKVKKV